MSDFAETLRAENHQTEELDDVIESVYGMSPEDVDNWLYQFGAFPTNPEKWDLRLLLARLMMADWRIREDVLYD